VDAADAITWRRKWYRWKALEIFFRTMPCLKFFDIYKCLICSLEIVAVGCKRWKLSSTTRARQSATATTPIRANRISQERILVIDLYCLAGDQVYGLVTRHNVDKHMPYSHCEHFLFRNGQ
jgi:hypothetical protein